MVFDIKQYADVLSSGTKNPPEGFFQTRRPEGEAGIFLTKEGKTMEIRTKSADRNLLLELSGELDHHGARTALRELEEALDAALPRKLVLDLSGITFMDSSGIALILRAQQKMQLLDGSLLVRGVPPQARRVLDAAGISRFVTIKSLSAN